MQRAISQQLELDRRAALACTALLWHGPGHQSHTLCHRTGVHEVHAAYYGQRQEYAEWTGDEAMTGFFDEPPKVVSDEVRQ